MFRGVWLLFLMSACAGATQNTDAGVAEASGDDSAAASPHLATLDGGRVLLIGNSHTSFGVTGTHIGELWHELNPNFEIDSIAAPGMSLEDHAASPTTLTTLAEVSYDVVVLQERSARYVDGDTYDFGAAEQLAAAARRGNPCVRIVFHQIQVDEASANYESVLPRYRQTSELARERLAGLLAPTGEVFANVRNEDRVLYDQLIENTSCCGFHATPLGGYVHALILNTLVSGRAPDSLGSLRFDIGAIDALSAHAAQVLRAPLRLYRHLALPETCGG